MQNNRRLLQQCTILRTQKHVQMRKNMYNLWFRHFLDNCGTTVYTRGGLDICILPEMQKEINRPITLMNLRE